MRALMCSIPVVAVITASVSAGGNVWLTAAPHPSIQILDQGPGKTLQYDCMDLRGPAHMEVTVHYQNDDGGAYSWALDFYAATGFVTASNLNVVSEGFPEGIQNGFIPNTNGILLQDQSGQILELGGAGPGDFILETFWLDIPNCNSGVNVWAGIGHVEFGGDDPEDGFGGIYEIIQIGANAPRPGYSYGGGNFQSAEPIPVIQHVPEPASLALFTLASVSCFRKPRMSRITRHD